MAKRFHVIRTIQKRLPRRVAHRAHGLCENAWLNAAVSSILSRGRADAAALFCWSFSWSKSMVGWRRLAYAKAGKIDS